MSYKYITDNIFFPCAFPALCFDPGRLFSFLVIFYLSSLLFLLLVLDTFSLQSKVEALEGDGVVYLRLVFSDNSLYF